MSWVEPYSICCCKGALHESLETLDVKEMVHDQTSTPQPFPLPWSAPQYCSTSWCSPCAGWKIWTCQHNKNHFLPSIQMLPEMYLFVSDMSIDQVAPQNSQTPQPRLPKGGGPALWTWNSVGGIFGQGLQERLRCRDWRENPGPELSCYHDHKGVMVTILSSPLSRCYRHNHRL